MGLVEDILALVAEAGRRETEPEVKNGLRSAYAQIRSGELPLSALGRAGLPIAVECQLIVAVRGLARLTVPVDSELMAFIESCTPTDDEIGVNRYAALLEQAAMFLAPVAKRKRGRPKKTQVADNSQGGGGEVA